MPHLIHLSHADIDSEHNLEGYDAYDRDDGKIGDIDGVIVDGETMTPRYLVVDAGGWFSSRQFVVPAGEIRRIDDDERRVYFHSLTRETLANDAFPRYDAGWWDTNDHAAFRAHERALGRALRPDQEQGDTVDYTSDLYTRPAEGAQRLQLLEERLRVEKERYQAGTVTIGKRITERTETLEVPVREERVVIERLPGSGQVLDRAAEPGEEAIAIPVMKERVNVGKEAVVSEEVEVRKEIVEDREQVRETVRKEQLVVDDPAELAAEPGSTGAGPAHNPAGQTR